MAMHEVYVEDGNQYRRIPGTNMWTDRVYGLVSIQSVDEKIQAMEMEMQAIYRAFYQETVDMTEEQAVKIFDRDYVDILDQFEDQIMVLEAGRRGVA